MSEALSAARSVEVTRAVRAARLNGFDIKRRQAIGLLDGALVAVSDQAEAVLAEALAKIDMDKAEVVTIYYGGDTTPAEAEGVGNLIRGKYPQLQVEVIKGGQPHYNYIVSVE